MAKATPGPWMDVPKTGYAKYRDDVSLVIVLVNNAVAIIAALEADKDAEIATLRAQVAAGDALRAAIKANQDDIVDELYEAMDAYDTAKALAA